jgi:hypothetical protein
MTTKRTTAESPAPDKAVIKMGVNLSPEVVTRGRTHRFARLSCQNDTPCARPPAWKV